ncbi:MAG: hypothetical protein FJY97_13465 [candidate division Zixibacteria bacterium]|nr:hypothetical protein [candidate division Zixibacteria bacterium]
MRDTNVVTLRMPADLKRRLETVAHRQGISLNQLSNYLLNTQISWLEAEMALEARLARQSFDDLRTRFEAILNAVPDREPLDWDRLPPSSP